MMKKLFLRYTTLCAFIYLFCALASAQILDGHSGSAGTGFFVSSVGTFDDKKAQKNKLYQCRDDGEFEPSTNSIVNGVVFTLSEVSRRARILVKPEAPFTEVAREHGTNGKVILKGVLTADGKIADIRVIKSLPRGLTENSIRAVCGIRFTPAMKDDHPVPQLTTFEYYFNTYL